MYFVKLIYKTMINYMYPKIPKQVIPKKVRNLVWSNYFKNEEGVCYACGRYIDIKNWHCSHVVSDKRGGQPIVPNLRPCCQHCNLSCGRQNLYCYIRDKKLTGIGKNNITAYMRRNPSQINSKR